MTNSRVGLIGSMAVAALLAGHSLGPGLVERPAVLRPEERYFEEQDRKERKRLGTLKVMRQGRGRRGPVEYRGFKLTSFDRIVNAMGNHRRNLWARDGYPGLQKKDIAKLQPYFSPLMWEQLRP